MNLKNRLSFVVGILASFVCLMSNDVGGFGYNELAAAGFLDQFGSHLKGICVIADAVAFGSAVLLDVDSGVCRGNALF